MQKSCKSLLVKASTLLSLESYNLQEAGTIVSEYNWQSVKGY